jgi:folate-binding protein YgfZ
MPKHHGRGEDRTKRIGHVLTRDRRGRAVDRFEHRSLSGMNVAAGGHAKASLQAGGQVGDDVAEHVIRDDDVELAGIADHLQAERVNVHMLRGDLRIFARDFLEHALPQASRVSHGIGLIAHEDLLARRAIEPSVVLAILEGMADDTLSTLVRVDVFLDRDFVAGTLFEYAASIRVNAFGVFADDDEIDVLRLDILQGAERRVEQPDRTDVGVEIHLEAHAKQNLFGMNVCLDARIAEGADQNGIEVTGQHDEAVGRNGHAVAQIAVGSPVELREGGLRAARLQHLNRLRNHLLADPVSGDDGDPFCTFRLWVHGRNVNTIVIIELQAMGLTALQVHGDGLGAAGVGEYCGATTAACFGDTQREFEAFGRACGVYDLGYRAKISITGRDRVRWMNGMVTNNIRDLAAGRGVYAFLLNPQGHILGDLYAYNRGESITVDTDASQLEKILATFDHYIIMDDVEVKDVSQGLTALGVAGLTVREVLRKAKVDFPDLQPLGFHTVQCDCDGGCLTCTILRGDHALGEAYEIWLAPAQVRPLWDALVKAGATPVGSEAVELRRIATGIPLYGVDIRERDLPQETEQARALNFNKGCYVGQEIVERIRSRGAVHRKLSGLLAEAGAQLVPGMKIAAGGKEVGEVTSVAILNLAGERKPVALGYVRREVGTPGREVTIGTAQAIVVQLPSFEAATTKEVLEHHRA